MSSKSEDILGHKWDVCVADSLVKVGGGFTLGVVFSVLFFKRRSWPIIFGLGAGTGMGYANCQNLLNQPYLVHADKVKIRQKAVNTELEHKEQL